MSYEEMCETYHHYLRLMNERSSNLFWTEKKDSFWADFHARRGDGSRAAASRDPESSSRAIRPRWPERRATSERSRPTSASNGVPAPARREVRQDFGGTGATPERVKMLEKDNVRKATALRGDRDLQHPPRPRIVT